MPTLLYIHGFLSSPQSAKALQTKGWLAQNRPDWQFECPFLSPHPADALEQLRRIAEACRGPLYLMGSSLGGFWATWLVEHYGCPAILINPAVRPHKRFDELVGQELANYHTGEKVTLSPQDLKDLSTFHCDALKNTGLYWVLIQKGDETLDYRDAVAYYRGCRQTVESGGDHSFQGFQHWLPEITEFLENPFY